MIVHSIADADPISRPQTGYTFRWINDTVRGAEFADNAHV
jgi:hypothetical protein